MVTSSSPYFVGRPALKPTGEPGWKYFDPGKGSRIRYTRPSVEYLRFLLHQPSDPGELSEWMAELELEVGKVKVDPFYWLFRYVRTLDEHDHDNPIKPWPDFLGAGAPYDYSQVITRAFMYHQITKDGRRQYPPLFLAKSRQMLISWLMAALCLWSAMYFRGKKVFVQSQKQEMADKILSDRMVTIYRNLPWFLKTPWSRKFGEVYFPENQSYIFGVAAGPDQARSYTGSVWFSDESAYQTGFAETYMGIRPMIDGGGRFVAVSSAAPGPFQELGFFEDRYDWR